MSPATLSKQGPSQSAIMKLGNDLLNIILQILHDSHPSSIASVRLVSSVFNSLAAYISCSVLKLDLSLENTTTTKKRLDHIEREGLLAAIRVIKVLSPEDDRDFSSLAPILSEPKGIMPAHIGFDLFLRLLPQMTGLTDIWWPNQDLSHQTLNTIRTLTQVRLHAVINPNYQNRGCGLVERLINSINLHSLNVQYTYTSKAESCLKLTRPLKKLLLSCPNLQSLTLNIGQPSSGCVMYCPPREYCGIGFVEGERPPPLTKLHLDRYPFGSERIPGRSDGTHLANSEGYTNKGTEQDYWAEVFDWSRLQSLHVTDSKFALLLMPKLTALNTVQIKDGGYGDDENISRFYLEVPAILEAISVRTLQTITLDGICRHGTALKELELHQTEGYQKNWGRDAMDNASLAKIRGECPLIEDLRLDISRSGEWPYDMLDTIARFPRLRKLTLWFELGVRNQGQVVEPKVTFSAVQMLFEYLRKRASTPLSHLQELNVYSGAPPDIGRGRPARQAFWPRYNSMHFRCKLAERDYEAAQGKFTCECPSLSKEANEYLRCERKDAMQQSSTGFGHEKWTSVAIYGPKSRSEWNLHY